ncbi:MAG: CAP domain-containing protein [Minisyncoccia bacterium]
MFSWLKKHFIPHAGNEHRPHILRDYSTRNLIVLILFFEIFSFLIPVVGNLNLVGNMAAVLPAVLGELTNEERASQNLGQLIVSPILNKAAEMKAEDMATKGYFAHTSPEGITPWYWLELAGYKYQYAGENLAVNFHDSKDVTQAWLNSPTHKANIVKGNYTEMGTGIAKGIYKGRKTIFVAQVYANPAFTVSSSQAISPKAEQSKNQVAVAERAGQAKNNDLSVLGAEFVPADPEAKPEPSNNITEAIKTDLKTEPMATPALWQKLLASPRNTTNIIMSVIFSIIAMALTLYIVIKNKNHHRDILTNGLAVLAVIGAVFATNYHYSYETMTITQSLDYSVTQN